MISPAVRLGCPSPPYSSGRSTPISPSSPICRTSARSTCAVRFARLIVRRELLARETLRGLLERALLGGEGGHRYFANLRNCGLRFSLKARTPSFDSSVA